VITTGDSRIQSSRLGSDFFIEGIKLSNYGVNLSVDFLVFTFWEKYILAGVESNLESEKVDTEDTESLSFSNAYLGAGLVMSW
jgi:hypothetical protein